MNYRPNAISSARILGLVVLSFVIGACSEEPEPEKEVIRPIKLMTIDATGSSATREYPGQVSATQSVEVSFEVPGRIIELPISDGMSVKKGDLLARLDPTDYRAARELAEANRKAAQSSYDRALRIFEQGAGSQADVDQRLRDIDVAKQELRTAQKALNDTTITAPFTGEVSRKIAEQFQNVQAKEAILQLEDLSSLELDVNVPEQDFVQVTPDLTLEQLNERSRPEIQVSTFPGRTFPARLISFETAADPTTRTYRATFGFENPGDVNILPGMTAKAIIHPPVMDESQQQSGALEVPVAAVITDTSGKAFVWLYDQRSSDVSKVEVSLGDMTGGSVVITSGLENGDIIAVAGAAHLREGMKVRPLDSK